MNEADIFDRLKAILREHTAIKAEVTHDTALIGQHLLDSMDFMNYLLAIETTWQITIPNEDITDQRLDVLKNMAAYVVKKTG